MSSIRPTDASPTRSLVIALGAGLLVLAALVSGKLGDTHPEPPAAPAVPQPPSGDAAVETAELARGLQEFVLDPVDIVSAR